MACADFFKGFLIDVIWRKLIRSYFNAFSDIIIQEMSCLGLGIWWNFENAWNLVIPVQVKSAGALKINSNFVADEDWSMAWSNPAIMQTILQYNRLINILKLA